MEDRKQDVNTEETVHGFTIKNYGFEHASIFTHVLIGKIINNVMQKIPFRAVIEYDPKRDDNTHVRIEKIKDENTDGQGSNRE